MDAKTIVEQLKRLRERVGELECEAAELMGDCQEYWEERGQTTPGITLPGDAPICAPEEAAPDLDGARDMLRSAWEVLGEEILTWEVGKYE